jgi:hypothetical protein
MERGKGYSKRGMIVGSGLIVIILIVGMVVMMGGVVGVSEELKVGFKSLLVPPHDEEAWEKMQEWTENDLFGEVDDSTKVWEKFSSDIEKTGTLWENLNDDNKKELLKGGMEKEDSENLFELFEAKKADSGEKILNDMLDLVKAGEGDKEVYEDFLGKVTGVENFKFGDDFDLGSIENMGYDSGGDVLKIKTKNNGEKPIEISRDKMTDVKGIEIMTNEDGKDVAKLSLNNGGEFDLAAGQELTSIEMEDGLAKVKVDGYKVGDSTKSVALEIGEGGSVVQNDGTLNYKGDAQVEIDGLKAKASKGKTGSLSVKAEGVYVVENSLISKDGYLGHTKDGVHTDMVVGSEMLIETVGSDGISNMDPELLNNFEGRNLRIVPTNDGGALNVIGDVRAVKGTKLVFDKDARVPQLVGYGAEGSNGPPTKYMGGLEAGTPAIVDNGQIFAERGKEGGYYLKMDPVQQPGETPVPPGACGSEGQGQQGGQGDIVGQLSKMFEQLAAALKPQEGEGGGDQEPTTLPDQGNPLDGGEQLCSVDDSGFSCPDGDCSQCSNGNIFGEGEQLEGDPTSLVRGNAEEAVV